MLDKKNFLKIIVIFILISTKVLVYANPIGEEKGIPTKKIKSEVNLTTDFKIMEQDIYTHDVFIVGDVRGTKVNTQVELSLAKYLNQKVGLQTIAMDIGYTQGKKVNEYISSGDEQLLNEIMEDMYPENRTEEVKCFFQNIRKYNQGFKQSLEIIGVGKDRKENTLSCLEKLLLPYMKNEQLQKDLKLAQEIPSNQIFKEWQKNINKYDSIYGELLQGTEWIELQLILNSVLEDTKEQKNITNLSIVTGMNKNRKLLYLGQSDEVLWKEPYNVIANAQKQLQKTLQENIEDIHILTIGLYYLESETVDWDGIGSALIPTINEVAQWKQQKDNVLFEIRKEDKNNTEYSILIKKSAASQPYKYDIQNAEDYVKKNRSIIDIKDNNFQGLKMLDKELQDHKIFLSGEYHGNMGSYDMQFYLSKYFHQKAGVNIILIECGYDAGELINKYVQTGNEDILHKVMEGFKGTSIYTNEIYNLIKKLHEYNQDQSSDKKIRVIGMDVVKKEERALNIIDELFGDIPQPKILRDIKGRSYTNKVEAYKELEKNIKDNYQYYFKSLGKENMFVLDMLLLSLTTDMRQLENTFLIRERVIIGMFEKILQYYPNEKIFGQMGAFHASQEYISDENDGYSCGEYLQKHSLSTKGQVISIMYDYQNSDYYLAESRTNKIDSKYPEVFKKYNASEFSMLDLTTSTNPLAYTYVKFQDNYITDTFQYYILIKDSKAATTYKN